MTTLLKNGILGCMLALCSAACAQAIYVPVQEKENTKACEALCAQYNDYRNGYKKPIIVCVDADYNPVSSVKLVCIKYSVGYDSASFEKLWKGIITNDLGYCQYPNLKERDEEHIVGLKDGEYYRFIYCYDSDNSNNSCVVILRLNGLQQKHKKSGVRIIPNTHPE